MDHAPVDPHPAQPRRFGHGLMGDDPELAGKLPHFHGEAHGRVHRPDTPVLQQADQPPPDLVHLVARVVELQVGDGPGRCADGLPVHAHHVADEGAGIRNVPQDVGPLIIEFGAVDFHETDIVCARVQRLLPQPLGLQRRGVPGRRGRWPGPDLDHGGMLVEFHGRSPIFVYANIRSKKIQATRPGKPVAAPPCPTNRPCPRPTGPWLSPGSRARRGASAPGPRVPGR